MQLPTALRESPTEGNRLGALRRGLATVIGDARQVPLNRRLFNSVSLLNAVTNIGGIPSLLLMKNPGRLVALNLGTGLIFLAFYFASRFGGRYRPLYWPFVLTILVFLFANMLFNAGTAGGAVWYLIPALVIATALAPRTGDAIASGVLFSAAALAILVIERRWPHLIQPYASEQDRMTDLAGNLVFALLFTGGLVLLLARTLNAERHRSEALLLNVLPQEIADELKRNARVVPCHYDSATILFADFVGFTRVSELLTPAELVEQLDRAFLEFDAISRAHHLEKIKKDWRRLSGGGRHSAIQWHPCHRWRARRPRHAPRHGTDPHPARAGGIAGLEHPSRIEHGTPGRRGGGQREIRLRRVGRRRQHREPH